MNKDILRKEILVKVKEYYDVAFNDDLYSEGDRIPFARRVFDENELVNLVDSSLDFWLTAGRYANDFEYEFAQFMDVEHCLLVNSGSSANLVELFHYFFKKVLHKPCMKNTKKIMRDFCTH